MQHERDFSTRRPPYELIMRRIAGADPEYCVLFTTASREEATTLLQFIAYLEGWASVLIQRLPRDQRPETLSQENKNFLALMQYKLQLSLLEGYHHPVTYDSRQIVHPRKTEGQPSIEDMKQLASIIEHLGRIIFTEENASPSNDVDEFQMERQLLADHVAAARFGIRIRR